MSSLRFYTPLGRDRYVHQGACPRGCPHRLSDESENFCVLFSFGKCPWYSVHNPYYRHITPFFKYLGKIAIQFRYSTQRSRIVEVLLYPCINIYAPSNVDRMRCLTVNNMVDE